MERNKELEKVVYKRAPVFSRVSDDLRRDIERGEYDAGLIPNMEDMAIKYNASRITVRNVLHSLQAEGLITIIQGSGTYLNRRELPPVPKQPEAPGGFALALRRYSDFLMNPNIVVEAKTRTIAIIDAQLKLVTNLATSKES